MNLKNKQPIFVPDQFQDEIEKLSKAALMDMVWDLAVQLSSGQSDEATMAELRRRRDVILIHRKQAATSNLEAVRNLEIAS